MKNKTKLIYDMFHLKTFPNLLVLSCQSRVTVTSSFFHKVIRDIESIDHLCVLILSAG